MVIPRHGWEDEFTATLFKKEASYNAGVTIDSANACSTAGFEIDVQWPDRIESDKADVTGFEFGTQQEIIEQQVTMTYSEAHARPNSLAGLAALVLGSVTATQDGAFAAYKHAIRPIAVSSALPSISVMHNKGGLKYQYDGVKGNSIEISGEAGGPVAISAELWGSGKRTSVGTATPALVVESWMLWKDCTVWREDGSSISISATPAQGVEDISSATPDVLGPRMKSFSTKFTNGLVRQPGFGGLGYSQDIDRGRRTIDLSFELIFVDSTELDLFVAQDPVAIELDCVGALIDPGGTYKYGFNLIIPKFQLKTPPLGQGGAGDDLTVTMDCEVLDDGTNPAFMLDVYTGKAAYIAA